MTPIRSAHNIDDMTTPAQQAPTDAELIQAAASAVGEGLSARCVILFGSRARDDHHETSDVDLAVIFDIDGFEPEQRSGINKTAAQLAHSAANGRFRRIDVLSWTEAEYRAKKRSVNHVAGRAWREGRILYGGHETYPGEEVVSELDNVREALRQCRRQLRGMAALVGPEADEENFGFHAQRAVELALKAWVSLAGQRYERTHSIDDLITTLTNAGATEAQAYTHLASVSPYAGKYFYEDVPEPVMDRVLVSRQVDELVEHVETLLR